MGKFVFKSTAWVQQAADLAEWAAAVAVASW